VLDVDDTAPRPFIVMDLIEGEPLAARCDGRIDVLSAISIGRDIASALAEAHAAGLVHRDVKPSNILIENRTGAAKLTDFGAAKLTGEGNPGLTELGTWIGTPRYMAPEQIEGLAVNARTDLFGLGATLYELLAGRPAFEGHTAGAVFAAILLREPQPLEQVRSDVPPELAELIRSLLTKDPNERPGSADEVLASLERLANVILPLADLPVETFEAGTLLMEAGKFSNRILVLKEGELEISKDGIRLNTVDEPGAILGELSVLLRRPHGTDVRTLRRSALHVADAATFFEDHPAVALHVATGLARRLETANERMLQLWSGLQRECEANPGLTVLIGPLQQSLGSWFR